MFNRSKFMSERNTTHGMSKTPEYMAWKDMKKRVLNPNNKRYKLYKDKGITIHKEWIDNFLAFFEHIGKKPDNVQTWTVGRIDNLGNYEPGNVRWETLAEQARNHSLQRNNTSGIVGVHITTKTLAGREYISFIAKYSDMHGKQKSKSFSINKYGILEAMAMAVKFREDNILKLSKMGVIYGENHGK